MNKKLKTQQQKSLENKVNRNNSNNSSNKDKNHENLELKLQFKNSHKESALFWKALQLQNFDNVSTQLITLSALLIPITAGIVSLEHIVLNSTQIIIVISLWIALLGTIGSGILCFIAKANYFSYLSGDESKREAIFHKSIENKRPLEEVIKDIKDLGTTNPHNKNIETSHSLQISFMTISILLTFILAISILIQPNKTNKKQNNPIYLRLK